MTVVSGDIVRRRVLPLITNLLYAGYSVKVIKLIIVFASIEKIYRVISYIPLEEMTVFLESCH